MLNQSICCVALMMAAVPIATAGADTLYVDDHAPPGGDGASWSSAYRFLQDAVHDAAAPGSTIDEIRVAQGVYRPDLSDYDHAVPGDVLATFQLVDGLALLGGYAGIGAADPDARDIELFETILSGDVLGDDTDDLGNMGDNIAAIVNASETESPPLVDGFTIVGGNGHNGNGEHLGGGILADPGFVTVRACTFHHNRAAFGGGIYVRYGGATIENSKFYKNRCTDHGAAIRVRFSSDVSVSNCDFVDNISIENGKGGAMAVEDVEDISVTGCRFERNVAGVAGGFSLHASQHVDFVDCNIVDNVATVAVGGGQVLAATTIVDRCTILGNEADLLIGGLSVSAETGGTIARSEFAYNTSGTAQGGLVAAGILTVDNCLIYRNTSGTAAGALGAGASFTNCTIALNSGYGLVRANGPVSVRNSIVWGNTPEQFGTSPIRGATPSVAYSCVEDGWPGVGNIDADPMFVQFGTGNLRLAHGSPCLDAGSNEFIPLDRTDADGDGNTDEPAPYDIDGSPRVLNDVIDMGAYEGSFDPLPPAASVPEFEPGELYVLATSTPEPQLGESVVLVAYHNSAVDHATLAVTDLRGLPGRTSDDPLIQIETNVPDGQALFSVAVPITPADLVGVDPFDADMTVFDQLTGKWLLAPALNATNSAGYEEPIGDRHVHSDGPLAVPNVELGDYGVYWNPDTQLGFIWTNIDHPGEFGLRFGMCPGDGAPYGGDHSIDIFDLFGVLDHWNEDHRWFDTDGNQFIDVHDVIHILENWGACD